MSLWVGSGTVGKYQNLRWSGIFPTYENQALCICLRISPITLNSFCTMYNKRLGICLFIATKVTLSARGFSCAVSGFKSLLWLRRSPGRRRPSADFRSRRDGEINLWYPGYTKVSSSIFNSMIYTSVQHLFPWWNNITSILQHIFSTLNLFPVS